MRPPHVGRIPHSVEQNALKGGAMQETLANINITADDLDGVSLEECTCRGCNGPLCGEKTPKLYEGKLVFICHLSEVGHKVLMRVAQRAR